MKHRILNILSPLLYACLVYILKQLKPLFVMENESVKEQLKRLEFHPALCAHPSILFGHREEATECNVHCLSLKLSYLKKAIKIGLLKTEKGHQLMQEFGIAECYGHGVDFWFLESHNPICSYTIPTFTNAHKRIAIYTALTGNYDNVNEILYKEDGVDYLLFTNNRNLRSNTWQIVYIESDLDNVLLSREIKMLPHKYLSEKYDASIYIDANAVIYGELSQLTNYLNEQVSFAVSKHGERNTVKDEVEVIIQRFKSVDPLQARSQYNQYVKNGFKDDLGLAECTILVRNHNEHSLIEVMDAWWTEFQKGIRRDQVSLLPCIAMLQFKAYVLMDGYVRHNQYCKIISHKK